MGAVPKDGLQWGCTSGLHVPSQQCHQEASLPKPQQNQGVWHLGPRLLRVVFLKKVSKIGKSQIKTQSVDGHEGGQVGGWKLLQMVPGGPHTHGRVLSRFWFSGPPHPQPAAVEIPIGIYVFMYIYLFIYLFIYFILNK